MKFSKLTKPLLTTFFGFYLSICPVRAQEQKQVEVNKKKYSLLEDKVTMEDNLVVSDKETLYKILKTSQIQEEIDSLNLNPAALKALELYAKGQELTIKYNEHIDWVLRLPFKILGRIVTGQPVKLKDLEDEFKDLVKEKLNETAGEIAKDPEKQLKFLAYAMFSNANEKAKFNLTILKTKPKLDCETAEKFERNSYFIEIFMKPSQQLYFDVENIRKLEERWTQTFIEEIKDTLPERVKELTDELLKEKWAQKLKEKIQEILPEKTKELTDKILEGYEEIVQKRLEELEPYKKFQDEISKRKEECEKSRIERQKALEEKIGKFIRSIKYDENIIVYVSDLTGNFEIYSMDKDGNNKIQLTNNGSKNMCPKWTPEKKIIFHSKKSGNCELYVMDRDGTNLKQLTNTPENECSPLMLSDGRIIFTSNKTGNHDIYVKEKDGTIKQLTNTKEDEEDLDISPDEKWICFQRNYSIRILNLETTLERVIGGGIYPHFNIENKVGYSLGVLWIEVKDINGNLQPSEFPFPGARECIDVIGYPEYLRKLTYIPKEPNTKEHTIYFLGWLDRDTIIYRFDLVKLRLPHEPEDYTLKNIYTFNLKTKDLKKLTNNVSGVWNDLADCLKK